MASSRQILIAVPLGLVLALLSPRPSQSMGFECVNLYRAQNAPALAAKSDDGYDWSEMSTRCGKVYPGYMPTVDFNDDMKAMCDKEEMLPITTKGRDDLFTWDAPSEVAKQWYAHRWSDNSLQEIDKKVVFKCAVCQMGHRQDVFKAVYPPHNDTIFEYMLELVTIDKISDTALVMAASNRVNELFDDMVLTLNLTLTSLRWRSGTMNADKKGVVIVYYNPGVVTKDWFFYVHWNNRNLKKPTLKGFELIDVTATNECKSNRLNLNSLKSSKFPIGYVETSRNLESKEVITRECVWNSHTLRSDWTPNTTWTFDIKPCSSEDMNQQISAHLGNYDINTALAVMSFSQSLTMEDDLNTRNRGTLKSIFFSLGAIITLHTTDKESKTGLAILDNSLPLMLAKMYTLHPKSFVNADFYPLQTSFVNLIIADSNTDDPVVGVAFKPDDNPPSRKTIQQTISRSNVTTYPKNTYQIVVTVSDSIVTTANRLAIATFANHFNLSSGVEEYDTSIAAWKSLIQVSFVRDESIVAKDDYVDISFRPDFNLPNLRGRCAERIFAINDWSNDNCQNVDSRTDGMVMCRCKNIYKEGNLSSSLYIIYGLDASYSAATFSLKRYDCSAWSMIWASVFLWVMPMIIS